MADTVEESFEKLLLLKNYATDFNFNSLFERYLDWAKIYNFNKFYILYQYGRQNSKYPTMSKNLPKSCYYFGIMRQILMSNSLSCLEGTYFDWTWILV